MASRDHTPPLNPSRIEKLEPREKDYELSDSAAPGLVLRVTANGTKVFRYYVTTRTERRRITIGRWARSTGGACVSLADARVWLDKLKEARKQGRLAEVEAQLPGRRPASQPDASPSAPDSPAALTVKRASDKFLANLRTRRRQPEQAERIFTADVLPVLGDRLMASITKRDTSALVEAIVARGSPVMATHVRAVLKQFFAWAVDYYDDLAMPGFSKADTLGAEKAGTSTRYLSADEIGAFWRALDTYKGMTPTVRHALRLLLLLGVRSGELIRATWDELDLDDATWTVPIVHQKMTKKREKDARPWTVPLPPTAVRLLRELKALAEAIGSEHVLASFHPAAAGEAVTEKSLNHAMRRLFTGKPPALSFAGERPTPHDLRRTVRTHLGKLGVARDIAERCLNHAVGEMERIYDQGDYVLERRAALEKWDAFVARFAGPAPVNVVPMHGKAVRS
jgi:integrase